MPRRPPIGRLVRECVERWRLGGGYGRLARLVEPYKVGHLVSIVTLSEFDQKLGNTRIYNSLIVQHSGYRPEVENQPNST